MSLKDIRTHYGVPALRGRHFWYCERWKVTEYIVTSAVDMRIKAKLADGSEPHKRFIFHPTYNLVWSDPEIKNKDNK